MDFYTGRVLRLDMTALTATVEPLEPDWARLYVGGKGLLLRYLFAELAPGTDALGSGEPAHPGQRSVRRHGRGDLLAPRRGLQEPGDRHAAGLLRRRLLRPGAEVRRLRPRGRDGQGPAPGPRARRGRPGGVPAGRRPLLGPRDGRPRAEGAGGDGPVAQGPLHGPGRRAARPLRLPLHRPVPQGRARRRRRRDGQQEPQGGGGARHRRGHRRRRAGVRPRPARAAERAASSPRTTPGPTRRARRSSSTSSTPPARCPRATGAPGSSSRPTASTRRSS